MKALCGGLGVLEGPVTCQDGSVVVTSIDQGVLYRIRGGQPHLLATTGGGPNGATEARDGTIYVAQNGGAPPASNKIRCSAGVQAITRSGEISLFGQRMVAPNDLCFGPDGFLYVTDPTRKPERDDGRIWRCNVKTHECELLFRCDWYPNGIGFCESDEMLYVADSRHCRIVRMPLANLAPESVETIVRIDHGIPDGFAFDVRGRLLVACPSFSASGDVQVYSEGRLVQVIRPGDSHLYTNLALSPDGRLYLCDASRGEVLVADWDCPGLALHPFRQGQEEIR